jgi:hypothetical protein
MSFSHDSCYGSDEVSVTSNGTASGQQSGSTPAVKQSFRPFLKSILKNSSAVIESDGESDTESGYSSDGIDSDYDALSDEEEDDDDNMSDFSVWDETSQDVPETQEDHTESFDDVFISFEENSVRFSPEVQYIDSPELSDDEAPDHQMTCHEMMMLARNSSGTQTLLDQLNRMDIEDGDEDEECHQEFVRKSATQPDEFSRDAVDLDRSLFVAYMNGIHGVNNKTFEKQYKTYLQAQVGHIRLGKDIDCMSSDNASSLYLDLISSHVNGTFFNLLAEEELNELITLRAEEQIGDQNGPSSSALDLDHHQVLLKKIERFLTERLTDGLVDVAPDELTLFAGGIVHDLGIKTPPAKV